MTSTSCFLYIVFVLEAEICRLKVPVCLKLEKIFSKLAFAENFVMTAKKNIETACSTDTSKGQLFFKILVEVIFEVHPTNTIVQCSSSGKFNSLPQGFIKFETCVTSGTSQ